MEMLAGLIASNQAFLIRSTLEYAKLYDYAKYTSTLEESWQVSIDGLSEALLTALRSYGSVPQIKVDEDYVNDPISAFGVIEARLHRNRGITLEMFLGLMKYYRQSYLDLVMEANWERGQERQGFLLVNRFFDRVELAFCNEWTSNTKEELIKNLQQTNRMITSEKNKYLTIFESISTPAIILDSENMIDNMNKAALEFLKNTGGTRASFYSGNRNMAGLGQTFAWLDPEFNAFIKGSEIDASMEKKLVFSGSDSRNVVVRFHRMVDINDYYKGTVIIFTDLTDRRQFEDRLRFMSFHDDLTGLYNRAFFQEELQRLDSGRFDPVAVIVCDIDGLKVVNDTLGHHAGDVLLTRTAAILRHCFRESDVVARIGGDEFSVLLPSCSPEALEEACERLKKALARHNQDNPLIPLSFSIGASLGDTRNRSIGQIFRGADNEMYSDKAANRAKYQLLFGSLHARFGNGLFRN